jgi:hypothetical protein
VYSFHNVISFPKPVGHPYISTKVNCGSADAEDIDDEIIEAQIAAFDGFCQCQAPGLEEPAEVKQD